MSQCGNDEFLLRPNLNTKAPAANCLVGPWQNAHAAIEDHYQIVALVTEIWGGDKHEQA
jgi:hypothetical protein